MSESISRRMFTKAGLVASAAFPYLLPRTAVGANDRILQVGSQQRDMAMNRVAWDFVRTGGLGRIRLVLGVNYSETVRIGPLPEEPAPEGMNWDMWLGQTELRPFNQELFAHWMRYWDYSVADMTNWGAHGIDQVQSALRMDATGPVEVWPLAGAPKGAGAFRHPRGQC